MKLTLAYGKNGLQVDVPNRSVVMEPSYLPGLPDEVEQALRALRQPIGTPPLRSMVKPTDRVCIVISDMTRPTPNHKLVPWIMQELDFVPRSQFVILNGTGSHRDNTREELIQMLGKDVVDTVRVINNDAFDKNKQAYIGTSSTGAEIYLHKEYVDSDFRIVTGFIEPHFFAGFSGGPKGVMPGIAGMDTIMHFHSSPMIADPLSTWGILEGNKVQSEATEIVLKCKPHFMLNVALNRDKQITAFFAGDVIEAHRAGCAFVQQHSMIACSEAFDIVITTNGGYPLDQNLYQAVKGMSAAQKIVKKGGAILCAAECSDGLPNHGNYARILQMRDTPQEILAMIRSPEFSMFDQWQVQKQMMVQMWADVYLYSSLQADTVRNAKLIPVENIEESLVRLMNVYGEDATIAVLPMGPLTIAYLE